MEDNIGRQVDEIEVLRSIYNELWCVEDESSRAYSMKIEEGNYEVVLFVTLPVEYPSESPPTYQLSAPWLRGPERQEICGQLEELYIENLGEPVLFLWIEKLRSILQKKNENNGGADPQDVTVLTASLTAIELDSSANDDRCEIPPITHGEAITDRKSVFQGHTAIVVTAEQVRLALSKLYENKKIANATHNIYAYRIYKEDTRTYLQDCEDDGEHQAGGRLLHLLQILDVKNVMVVVTRWYGGILLGPDRFRHINNAARQVLESAGHIKSSETKSCEKHTKRKN